MSDGPQVDAIGDDTPGGSLCEIAVVRYESKLIDTAKPRILACIKDDESLGERSLRC